MPRCSQHGKLPVEERLLVALTGYGLAFEKSTAQRQLRCSAPNGPHVQGRPQAAISKENIGGAVQRSTHWHREALRAHLGVRICQRSAAEVPEGHLQGAPKASLPGVGLPSCAPTGSQSRVPMGSQSCVPMGSSSWERSFASSSGRMAPNAQARAQKNTTLQKDMGAQACRRSRERPK